MLPILIMHLAKQKDYSAVDTIIFQYNFIDFIIACSQISTFWVWIYFLGTTVNDGAGDVERIWSSLFFSKNASM